MLYHREAAIMRVVINTRFGGFSLSVAAQEEYARLSGIPFETVPTFLASAAVQTPP